jgi:(1->4)-alpha-D-glucan 1-alpha-D-glucosylmutase
VQLEDAFGVREQPNLPGSVAPAYPCWRLKMPLNLEEWRGSDWLRGIVQPLRQDAAIAASARPGGHGSGGQGAECRPEFAIPRATYRLQLHRDFNLRQVTRCCLIWTRSASAIVICRRCSRRAPAAGMAMTSPTTAA